MNKKLFSILVSFAQLMRINKPIGIFLLLWPTLWALLLAGKGHPDWNILLIFVCGVVLMRSAGCVINDMWDRDFDKNVARTKTRPLASGAISLWQAMSLFAVLMILAVGLLYWLNPLTRVLACVGFVLTASYPLFKRITHLPQLILGIAFAWPIPMSYSVLTNSLPLSALPLFLAALVWPVMYDTLYAMTDRADDLKIGVKSTAILFGDYDRLMVGLLQVAVLILLWLVGIMHALSWHFYLSLVVVLGCFIYQQMLIHDRNESNCFAAFLHNNYVGLCVTIGLALSFYLA